MSLEMQKEIQALRDTLKAQSECMDKLLEHSKERDKKVDEMYTVFTNGTFLVTVLKWLFATTLALGGAYIMFKDIIHEQVNLIK